MAVELLKRAAWFLVFVLAQVIVLGRIHLFGVATPLLYVYFVLQFERNCPKWASLLWSFLMGLCVDIFSNTPGVATASMTLIAALQPYYFELFVPRDSVDDLKPSIVNLTPVKYSYYAIPLVLLYCIVFFTLEFFSFFEWWHWMLCVVGSTLITLVFIYTLEVVKSK